MREKGAANLSTYTARLPYDDDDDDEVSISISVRPILMSDIGHRRIGGNFTHRRSKGSYAPISDAPNLQRPVYDVAVSAGQHKHIMHARRS